MNVVLIIFDSFRKECIKCFDAPPWRNVYTPNLARFAEESFILAKCYPESFCPFFQQGWAYLYRAERVYPFKCERYHEDDFAGIQGWGPILESRTILSEMVQVENYTKALI